MHLILKIKNKIKIKKLKIIEWYILEMERWKIILEIISPVCFIE